MKYMACNTLEGEFVPIQAFQEAQNSFYFVNKDKDECYVMPYVVVTDGHDILVRENSIKNVDVGWRYNIRRPNGWRIGSSPEQFNKIVESGIKKCFLSMWKEIKGAQQEEIKLHASNRGFYSLNRRKFYPVYFITIPNNKPVNLIFKDQPTCFPIRISKLATDHQSLPTTFAARKVMEMINGGEIILPEVRNG